MTSNKPPTIEQHLAAHVADIEDGDLEVAPFASCECGWHVRLGYSQDWAAHVADAWREARTVRTRPEVDRLARDTVVQFHGADHIVAIRDMCCAGCYDLPALILWTPEDGAL